MTTEQRLIELTQAIGADIKDLLIKSTTYIHNQMTPDTVWVVVHGLGKFPSVGVADSAGTVVSGQIDYVDSNTIHISFSFPFSGNAYLN